MERRRETFLRRFEKVVSLGYELTTINPENLDILNQRPKNPAVIYFNHAAQDDALVTVSFLHNHAPERLKKVVMPVSQHHLQFKNFASYSLLVRLGKGSAGFLMPDVVQSYRRRGENLGNDAREKALALDLRLAHILKESLADGYLIIISPEGHRSDTGSLYPGEGGVGVIARLMQSLGKKGEIENGYFIPLGLIFQAGRQLGRYYNPIVKPSLTISVGSPIDYETVLKQSGKKHEVKGAVAASHFLMERLAGLLPEHMRGVYSSRFIEDTYRGRYEQRLGKNETVYIFDNKEGRVLDS